MEQSEDGLVDTLTDLLVNTQDIDLDGLNKLFGLVYEEEDTARYTDSDDTIDMCFDGVVDGPYDAAAVAAVQQTGGDEEEGIQPAAGDEEEGVQQVAGDEVQEEEESVKSPDSVTSEGEEESQPLGEGSDDVATNEEDSRSSSPIQCGQRSPVMVSQSGGGHEDRHHSHDAQQSWWEGDAEWEANMGMLPSVDTREAEEEEARAVLHGRQVVFGFAAVCGEFRLPLYSSQHDRNDKLLCGQFVIVDTERCLFLVVGIDPLREFDICLRLANTRTRGICRFERPNDIFAMVKSRLGRADSYR